MWSWGRALGALVVGGLLAPTLAAPSAADPVTGSAQGYIEARYHAMFGLDADLASLPLNFDRLGFHPDRPHGASFRARPTAKLRFGDHTTLLATAQAWSFVGFFEREHDELEDIVTLERLSLSSRLGPLSFTLGKLGLAWGSGLFYHPTDPYNTVPATDLRLERIGVWGGLATLPLGEKGAWTVSVTTRGTPCCDVVAVSRTSLSTGTTDATIQVSYDDARGATQVGLDVRGEAEIGMWFEGTWTALLHEERGYAELELGVDYTFEVLDYLYVGLEYLLLSDGGAGAAEYTATLLAADPDQRPRLLGQHYAVMVGRLGILSNLQWVLVGLLNANDPSGAAVSQLIWLLDGWFEVLVGLNWNFGAPGSEFRLAVPNNALLPPELRGSVLLPQGTAYLWTRMYF
jgi:hypothetical protein